MTTRLGGPLVGALVGLAAAGLGAVFIADELTWRTFVLACGPVAVAAVVAVATGRSLTPPPAAAAPVMPGVGPHSGPIPAAQLAEPARAAQALTDRSTLVEACIWMRDRATSPALASQLDQTFQKVGVAAVDATGQRFDPAVHEAGATVAAPGPAEDGIIARTETVGYADRGRLLRHPVVTVYRGQVRA
ncbi:nucleotide exchange factor GrpE [Glycomyces arizonensis]|uniref:nucleotide exchange factor GrpE n=1 Tax=Glycomyces arizonensis TaxID=256035 RepID=UPI001B7FAD91|nr:nucleotide exchange factor GrpE [Glycomyces arizonensis]